MDRHRRAQGGRLAALSVDDANEVRGILDRYAVRYVYLGSLERLTYGPDAAPRLAGMHDVFRIVYRNPFVVILAVRPRPEGPR